MTTLHFIKRVHAVILVALFISISASAQAWGQDENETPQITEEVFSTYHKLRYAEALSEARRMFAGGKTEKIEAAKAEFEKAVTDVGWTMDKFRSVDDLAGSVAQSLRDAQRDGEEAQWAKEQLAEYDKTTVATIKAHLEELDENLSTKAEQQVREEREAAKRGTVPTPAAIEGKWVWDLDLTVAALTEELPESIQGEIRKSIEENTPQSTYTFGPGNKIVAEILPKGSTTPRVEQGTYRIDGNALFIKPDGREREQKLQVGMKNGNLQIGMFGAYSVFKRAQ